MTVSRERLQTAFVFSFTAAALILAHAPYFNLPFFWDELGQFVPAALDILRRGAWIPVSAVPNVHPPGVMAYLAVVWRIAGYSIPATRIAMLLLGSLTLGFTYLLARETLSNFAARTSLALTAILFLFFDPLFFTQSMMAQLDMPVALLTIVVLYFFVRGIWSDADEKTADRSVGYAALFSVPLVLAKETGILVPALCAGALLLRNRRDRRVWWFIPPAIVLAIWLSILWRTTGNIMGDPGFMHYNVGYALHPMRIVAALGRRIWYLFFAEYRFLFSVPLFLVGWRGLRSQPWRFLAVFFATHMILVSVLGGAELERYLLPVLPILYVAFAAVLEPMRKTPRIMITAAFALCLLTGWFVNPLYPFPYENNLAMADFVRLQVDAARFVERHYPDQTVYTAWPLTTALRSPEFGYVERPLTAFETSDLHASTISRLPQASTGVLILYSRTWEPANGVLSNASVRRFLARYYDYEPQITAGQVRARLGLERVARWDRNGQWIEVYARTTKPTVGTVAKPMGVATTRSTGSSSLRDSVRRWPPRAAQWH